MVFSVVNGGLCIRRKPLPGAVINYNDPLTYDLAFCTLFNEAANIPPANLYRGPLPTVNGTVITDITGKNGGMFDPCLDFNGTDGWLDYGAVNPYIMEGAPLSVETWINPDAAGTAPRLVARNSSTTVVWYLDIETSGTDALRWYYNYTGGTNTDAKAETQAQCPAIGVWTHIVATLGTDHVPHLYVNGAEVTYFTQVTGNASPSTSLSVGLSIGAKSGTAVNFFDGKIGLVRVWNGRELTAIEANELYTDPYRMFRLEGIDLFSAIGPLGTSVEIVATAGAATANTTTPTITTQQFVNITGVAGAAIANTVTPVVSTKWNINVTGAVGASTADTTTPSISTQVFVNVAGVAGEATANTTTPVITAQRFIDVTGVVCAATADTTTPSTGTGVTVGVSLTKNILSDNHANGTEDGTTTGITGLYGASVSSSDLEAYEGLRSIRMQGTAGGMWVIYPVPVVGCTYKISGYLKGELNGENAHLGIISYDSGWTWVGEFYADISNLSPVTWQYYSATGVIPVNAYPDYSQYTAIVFGNSASEIFSDSLTLVKESSACRTQPSVSTGNGLTASAGAAIAGTTTPTISTQQYVDISHTSGAATGNTTTPSVSTQTVTNVSTTPGLATGNTVSPSISTAQNNITTSGAAVANALTHSLSAGLTLAATCGGASGSSLTHILSTGLNISATCSQAQADTVTPTITTWVNISAVRGLSTANSTTPTLSFGVGANISATAGAATAGSLTHAIGCGNVITAGACAATSEMPTPTVTTTVNVTAQNGAALAGVTSPGLSIGHTVSVVAGSATAGTTTPSVSHGVNAGATAGLATANTTSSSISAGGTISVTASVCAATADTVTPTLSYDFVITSTVGGATAVIITPIISRGWSIATTVGAGTTNTTTPGISAKATITSIVGEATAGTVSPSVSAGGSISITVTAGAAIGDTVTSVVTSGVTSVVTRGLATANPTTPVLSTTKFVNVSAGVGAAVASSLTHSVHCGTSVSVTSGLATSETVTHTIGVGLTVITTRGSATANSLHHTVVGAGYKIPYYIANMVNTALGQEVRVVIDVPLNVGRWVPVWLKAASDYKTPTTGVAYNASGLSVTIKKNVAVNATKTLTTNTWKEFAGGLYLMLITDEEADTNGTLCYLVEYTGSLDYVGVCEVNTTASQLAKVGAGVITTISPVAVGGKVSIIQGDDYLAVDSRALEWTEADATSVWPDLTGATVVFSMDDLASTTYPVTVVTPTGDNKKIRCELTDVQTDLIEVGRYNYSCVATLTNASVVTLAVDVAKVTAAVV